MPKSCRAIQAAPKIGASPPKREAATFTLADTALKEYPLSECRAGSSSNSPAWETLPPMTNNSIFKVIARGGDSDAERMSGALQHIQRKAVARQRPSRHFRA